MITIVLADDHHLVRQGVRALLEPEPDFSIVGEEGDGLKVIEMVDRLRPDVAVIDLMMPGLNGLEVTRQVSRRTPGTHILILSMHANEAYVVEALRNGATGYILKDTSAEVLIQGVRQVATGRRYLCPSLSERLIETYLNSMEVAAEDPYDTLTSREREVLQLAAEGYHNSDIAARLSISTRTVEVHRNNLMHKLALKTQTDLIRYALKRGLVTIDG